MAVNIGFLTEVYVPQRMNHTDFAEPLTDPLFRFLDVLTTTGWISMRCGTDIHGAQKINH